MQDFLELRKYTYERLDGSIRAEERFAAIRNFSQKAVKKDSDLATNQFSPFVFLISTRAGGVGLNLVAADTVRMPFFFFINIVLDCFSFSQSCLLNKSLYVNYILYSSCILTRL